MTARGGGNHGGGHDGSGGSRGVDHPGRTTSTGSPGQVVTRHPPGDDGSAGGTGNRWTDGLRKAGDIATSTGDEATRIADGVSSTTDAISKVRDSVGSLFGNDTEGKGSGGAGFGGAGSGGGIDSLRDTGDPLQGLVSGGVGWLVEHVAFLREPLDFLAGDPDAITRHAQNWRDVAQQLTRLGEQRQTGAQGLSGWQGEAADRYQETAGAQVEAIRAGATAAENLAEQVLRAGEFLGSVRQLVKDLISDFVEAMVQRALLAVGLAAETLGVSVAVFIADAVAEATVLASRCIQEVTRATEVLGRIGQGLQALGGVLDGIGQALGKVRTDVDGAIGDLGRPMPPGGLK